MVMIVCSTSGSSTRRRRVFRAAVLCEMFYILFFDSKCLEKLCSIQTKTTCFNLMCLRSLGVFTDLFTNCLLLLIIFGFEGTCGSKHGKNVV